MLTARPLSLLSTGDVDCLAEAGRLLASPLDHDSIDDWRRNVSRTIRCLVRGDSAAFLLPGADGELMFSEEHDPAELARYPDTPQPLTEHGEIPIVRALQLRVATMPQMYGRAHAAYLASAYHNEYAAPNGAHDALVMVMSLGDPSLGRIPALQFWHASERGERFDERHVRMLKLLHPSFEAGVKTVLRLGAARASLIAALDAQHDGALVIAHDGRVLHCNRALAHIVPARTGEQLVTANAREMAAALVGDTASDVLAAATVARRLRVRGRTLRLTAVRLGAGVFAPQPVTLVTVTGAAAPPPTRDELRARFGLTRRQAEVALLLAQRLSTPEIAERLVISPHTAARHAEAVMAKLDVRDRRCVGQRLTG